MLVGAIGIGLLGAAGLITSLGVEGNNDMWSGACLKVGLVMGALWLALPSITRNEELGRASWMAVLGAIAVALIIARTKVSLKMALPQDSWVIWLVSEGGRRKSSFEGEEEAHPGR